MIQFQYVQPPELTIEQQAMINMYMNILNRSCDKVPSDNTNDQTLDYLYEVYILTFKDRNTKNCWISGTKFINYSTVIAEKVIINGVLKFIFNLTAYASDKSNSRYCTDRIQRGLLRHLAYHGFLNNDNIILLPRNITVPTGYHYSLFDIVNKEDASGDPIQCPKNADTSAMKPALIFNPHDDEIFKQYYDMNNEKFKEAMV